MVRAAVPVSVHHRLEKGLGKEARHVIFHRCPPAQYTWHPQALHHAAQVLGRAPVEKHQFQAPSVAYSRWAEKVSDRLSAQNLEVATSMGEPQSHLLRGRVA
eukprot:CAMPEP_0181226294 /NCGR_PEP_ID=MMETSP1096-20121128/32179_1 /TAXON_ID=156174 ORGANISM="Chrysochromulina ericina, Strain CCMP281" /NCGR_SAMPLE_ID=MMETSP1096 /ASSEMBLY_ACC=CAM_ASM_000453 /LENGTH=101 /DNA_ID=CAMNT_0023319625 /DNA_START=1338 /DNA_END=1639 /DNA_ORIENTATION=-